MRPACCPAAGSGRCVGSIAVSAWSSAPRDPGQRADPSLGRRLLAQAPRVAADRRGMSTWRATPGTRAADAAADRLLGAAAAAWALADRLRAQGDRAHALGAEALADALLRGAPPARLHYVALALG